MSEPNKTNFDPNKVMSMSKSPRVQELLTDAYKKGACDMMETVSAALSIKKHPSPCEMTAETVCAFEDAVRERARDHFRNGILSLLQQLTVDFGVVPDVDFSGTPDSELSESIADAFFLLLMEKIRSGAFSLD